jgi:hypothetical protein
LKGFTIASTFFMASLARNSAGASID